MGLNFQLKVLLLIHIHENVHDFASTQLWIFRFAGIMVNLIPLRRLLDDMSSLWIQLIALVCSLP